MSVKLLRWKSHYQSLYENIYCYFINQKMVDITLICIDGEIKAHSVILCAASRFFQNILNNYENQKIFFERSISKMTMQYILEFIYKGQVAVPNSDLKNVLDAAAVYEIHGIMVSNNEPFSTIQIMENLTTKVPPSEEKNITTENTTLVSFTEMGHISSPTVEVSTPKDADFPTEKHSSTSSPELVHIDYLTDRVYPQKKADESTKKHSPADVGHKKTSSLTSLLKKNPVALTRKKNINAERDNVECRKEKRTLLRHGSRKWNDLDISDDSVNSDSTLVININKPHTSEQADDKDGDPVSDEEVEAVIQKSVPDTINSTLLSQDLCKGNAGKRFEPFLSTDDDSDYEPLKKISKRKATQIGKDIPKKIQNQSVGKTSERKIKKYNDLLVKTKMKDVDQYCVVCNKFYEDIAQHIKINHKIWPRKSYPCKKCKKEFYLDSFLKDNHKCIEK